MALDGSSSQSSQPGDLLDRLSRFKHYFTNKYLNVRLLENGIFAMPFIVFLLVKSLYVPAMINFILAMTFAFIKSGSGFNYVIPTPFSKTPFEFHLIYNFVLKSST